MVVFEVMGVVRINQNRRTESLVYQDFRASGISPVVHGSGLGDAKSRSPVYGGSRFGWLEPRSHGSSRRSEKPRKRGSKPHDCRTAKPAVNDGPMTAGAESLVNQALCAVILLDSGQQNHRENNHRPFGPKFYLQSRRTHPQAYGLVCWLTSVAAPITLAFVNIKFAGQDFVSGESVEMQKRSTDDVVLPEEMGLEEKR